MSTSAPSLRGGTSAPALRGALAECGAAVVPSRFIADGEAGQIPALSAFVRGAPGVAPRRLSVAS